MPRKNSLEIKIPDFTIPKIGIGMQEPKSTSKKRNHIPSKLRREKMSNPKKCKWCKKAPVYELHHINGNRSNRNPNNLIGLCGNCHHKATRGEITKKQLKKRLGIKERRIKRTKKQREPQPKYFWES